MSILIVRTAVNNVTVKQIVVATFVIVFVLILAAIGFSKVNLAQGSKRPIVVLPVDKVSAPTMINYDLFEKTCPRMLAEEFSKRNRNLLKEDLNGGWKGRRSDELEALWILCQSYAVRS